MGCFRVGGWFLPCCESGARAKHLSHHTQASGVAWQYEMETVGTYPWENTRMFQMMANKDTLRILIWYIHDLEQEFCGQNLQDFF